MTRVGKRAEGKISSQPHTGIGQQSGAQHQETRIRRVNPTTGSAGACAQKVRLSFGDSAWEVGFPSGIG